MPQIRTLSFSTALLFALLLAAPDVFAQIDVADCDFDPTACSVISSSTSSTTTGLVGGIILALLLTGTDSVAQAYVKQNQYALMRDIYRGTGPNIADLAEILGVKNKERFRLWMKTNRIQITPIILDPSQKNIAKLCDAIRTLQESPS